MSEKKKVKINGFVFTDEAEAEAGEKGSTWDLIMWKNAADSASSGKIGA